MTLISGADGNPARREDARASNQINRAVAQQRRECASQRNGSQLTSAMSRQILAQREVKTNVRHAFIRHIQRAIAAAKSLNHAATSTERSKIHILSLRISLLDEADVGAEIDVLVQSSIEGHDYAIIEIACAAPAFQTCVKLTRRRNLEERNNREAERIFRTR